VPRQGERERERERKRERERERERERGARGGGRRKARVPRDKGGGERGRVKNRNDTVKAPLMLFHINTRRKVCSWCKKPADR